MCCLLIPCCVAETEESGENEMKIPVETVETNDFSMDYFRFGKGKNVFVILPGLSVESVMKYADAVAQEYSLLTDDYTVYMFDRRKEVPETYSVSDMARDTAAVFRALGLRQVSLFGASQGGMIAMTIAMEYPELVGRLILGSTSACVDQKHFRTIENWIHLAEAGRTEDLYLAFGEAVYPPDVFEQSKDWLSASAKSVTPEDLRKFVILAESVRKFDVTDRLQAIACPVLVIGSEDDRVLGAEASRQIAEKLKDRPDCGLFMYNGYGHAAYDLAPDYRERILRFLVSGITD